MSTRIDETIAAVGQWCKAHGIGVSEQPLAAGKAGEFYGVSIAMNSRYAAEERLYYLVHAVGSIVRWSLSRDSVQQMFDELRDSKREKDTRPERLEAAIERFRAFETESSQFAVWLFTHLGYENIVPAYSNFMSADLEAITQFHRTGRAPVWRDFFQRWNEDIAAGRRSLVLFPPKPIPPFKPLRTEKQEILQQQE